MTCLPLHIGAACCVWATTWAMGAVPATGPATQAVLEQRIPQMRFDILRFEQALRELRDATNANLLADWRALEPAGVTRDTPITADVSGLRMGEALAAVLANAGGGQAKLGYVLDDNLIRVSTAEALDRMVVRVYDVRDLLKRFAAARETAGYDAASRAIVNSVREATIPEGWDESPPTVRAFAGRLVITTHLSVQEKVAAHLAKRRQQGKP